MQKMNPVEKSFFNERKGTYLIETSALLADFFNGVVIEIEEEYTHE